jgi:glycosyltransferase involved in cell wall biosynthesis
MRARIRRLHRRHAYDLVLLDMLHLADYMDLFPHTPVVLGEHNVEYVILKRRAENETRLLGRLYLRYQCTKLRRFEARACTRATHVIAVSAIDARLLREIAPLAHITVVPNGVDTAYFAGADLPTSRVSLVYVGGFTWFPNQDAIQYFCDQMLPLIVKQIPTLVLTVIGKNPDSAVTRKIAATLHVRLAGQVDDIRPHVAAATVYIVPLRIGGGTRLKILDAMAMSKAIVSTSVGCEGLDVEDGRNIVIADAPERFADAVVRLMKDPERALELGRQGRMLAERRYDWSVLAADLLQVCSQAVGTGAIAPLRTTGTVDQSDQPRHR